MPAIFTLTIRTDNDAFGPEEAARGDTFARDAEIAAIFRRLAARLESDPADGEIPLFDTNGNRVGVARFGA